VATPPPDPRRAADNALWHALEERREAIRAAGLTFSERQHHQLREAWHEHRLIDALCNAMEDYTHKAAPNPYYLRPMAQAIKKGLETWEHVLIRRGEPWTRYVTPKARRGANKVIADATAYIPFL
jgi:hypothetical protein